MSSPTLTRRDALQAGGALLIAIPLVSHAAADTAAGSKTGSAAPASATDAVAGYLRIGANGEIRLTSPVSEIGQGTHTAHAALIADELGVPVARIRVEVGQPGPLTRRVLPGMAGPGTMSTAGSWGVRYWHDPLRRAGAQARAVLVAAAASEWSVPADAIECRDGELRHPASRRRAPLGRFAAAAAALPLPEKPPLRAAAELRHVGRDVPRLDLPGKARGTAVYTSDFTLPGMLYACARLSPVYRSDVESLDPAPALAIPGVVEVVQIPMGAAVVARNSWAAMRGAQALAIRFRPTPHDGLDSARISSEMRAGLDRPKAAMARDEGDVDAALAAAAQRVEADYEVPYLAHACMEPFACVVRVTEDGCEVWSGTQGQDRMRSAIARAHGFAPEKVVCHTLYSGGGFGRRTRDDEAFAGAVTVARTVKAPVRFFWTREDEIAQGWYRPAQVARLRAALDAEGRVTGLSVRTAGPSMQMDFAPAGTIQEGGLDASSVQSLRDTRYRPGALRIDYAMVRQPVPTAPWTAVGSTQNGYFLECFLDEVARAANKDPWQLRRELLAHDARALRVLDVAADRAGWGKPLPAGHALGIAYVESYGSICAQVAEVSAVDGRPRVHRMVVAIDCGDVILPNAARSQVEGRVIQGISVALMERMPIANGAAAARSFAEYPVIRIGDVPPRIDVHFIRSRQPLGGIGEPPLPPATAAVVNAWAKLTGSPVRRLPIGTA